MLEDKSSNNYSYPTTSIIQVIENPDEYIIPECLEACKKLWNMNIFTVACSDRREKKDKYGNIKKYIMVSNLSNENKKNFEDLVKLDSEHYCIIEILNIKYYVIVILSNDKNRDKDSENLLNLVSPFKIQDCLEGYDSIMEYCSKNDLGLPNLNNNTSASFSESEYRTAAIKHLGASDKLDLLDLDRGVVYRDRFYKNAHLRYLDMLKKESPDLPEHDF